MTDIIDKTIIRQQPYFQGLPERVLEPLYRSVQYHVYRAGDILFWEGDAALGLYIIQRGRVKLYKESTRAREMIVKIVYAGESFNEVAALDDRGNPVNAKALEDVQVLLIPAEVFRREIYYSPELAQTVMFSLCGNIRGIVDRMATMSFYQLTHRLAKLLLSLTPEQLSGENRLSQNDMAAHLGTVREVVARMLKTLQRKGVIELQRGNIVIKDRALLEEMVDFDV